MSALLAAAVLGERLPLAGWLGILVSLFGTGLIAAGEAGGLRPAPGSSPAAAPSPA